jgi:hypothetical protein
MPHLSRAKHPTGREGESQQTIENFAAQKATAEHGGDFMVNVAKERQKSITRSMSAPESAYTTPEAHRQTRQAPVAKEYKGVAGK